MESERMNDLFYNIEDDIKDFPDAWAYLVVGGRGTGKTYGSLKSCHLNKRCFVFVKRTIEDVKLLCTSSDDAEADFSPFKSVNRDLGCNIRARMIKEPVGAFYYCDEEDKPIGAPLGYIVPLSAVSKVKGFDLSEAEWLILDEFIPEPWERINHSEGEQIMELYMTISRAREVQGKPALLLIALANAVNISNPLMNILEVTDIFAELNGTTAPYFYDIDRMILCRMLTDNDAFREKQKESKIFKAMANTSWGQMAFENSFSFNDFSNVTRQNLKGFKPVTGFQYKLHKYYVYMKDGYYYACTKRHDKGIQYNLNKENDQKLFYTDYVIDLKNECINGKMGFEKYTIYDILINYKKFFKI